MTSSPRSDLPAPAAMPRTSPPPARTPSVPWRSVGIFSGLALAVLALCAAPFWLLDGGIAHPLFTPLIAVGMAGPLIATVVVAKLVDRVAWRDAVGLRFRGRWRRLALWTPLAVLLIVALNAATAVLMVLRGVPGDLSGRTWAGIVTDQFAEAGAEMPTSAAIALVLLSTAFGVLVTAVPAFGEEVGWRGWLWPRLKPLGMLGGVVVGGVIWSLWHLPVTLIGYNYPGAPRPAAIGMFVLACIAMNLLFGAITERAGGNPIPAAFAHATLNSTLGLALGIVSTQETPAAMNPFVDTPLGLIGIVLMAAAGLLILPRGAGDRPAALPDAAA